MRNYLSYGQGESAQLALDIAPPHSRSEAMMRAGRGLPDDEAGLLSAARTALRSFAGIMARDPTDRAAMQRIDERLDAIRDRFPDRDEDWLSDKLRVEGEIPAWGQPGRFVVTVADTRVVCSVQMLFGYSGFGSLSCEALDFDRPWLTETGYWSLLPQAPCQPMSVETWVIQSIEGMLWEWHRNKQRQRRLREIDEQYRAPRPLSYTEDDKPVPDPAWLPGGWLYQLAQHPPSTIPKPVLRKRAAVKRRARR